MMAAFCLWVGAHRHCQRRILQLAGLLFLWGYWLHYFSGSLWLAGACMATASNWVNHRLALLLVRYRDTVGKSTHSSFENVVKQ